MPLILTGAGEITGLTSVPSSGLQLADANMPLGSILQVVSTTKTDTFSTNNYPNYVAVTGLSVTITPTSASSKILVMVNICMGSDDFSGYYILRKNGVNLVVASTDGTHPFVTGAKSPQDGFNANQQITPVNTIYLDSPNTTSATTYQPFVASQASGRVVYVNRSSSDRSTSDYDPRVISSITVMEIAA